MRSATTSLYLLAALSAATACSDDESAACPDGYTCTPTGGAAGQGGTGGQGGAGGGTPAGCIPSEADGPVADDCGVFVSSSLGDDSNSGTKQAPFATVTAAFAAANGKAVYLCAEPFPEAVDMTAGTDIYGALACADGWTYTPAMKSAINAPPNTPALRITGAGTSTIADVAVTAASATELGESSIAALVDGSTVDFQRVDITAGDGFAGANGATSAVSAMDGINGIDGEDGCTSATTVVPPPSFLSHPLCATAVARVRQQRAPHGLGRIPPERLSRPALRVSGIELGRTTDWPTFTGYGCGQRA